LIRFHEADIFGLQEALIGQIQDINKVLPEYDWIGVGRDDGKEAGEYSPIFYRKSTFSAGKKGWFWLAEECDKPVIGWDAACKRICTWVILKIAKSKKKILVLNTHFDHIGNIAREKSADLILQKIKEINPDNLPVVLTGDFNLTSETKPITLIKQQLFDSKELSKEPPFGPEGTFNSFNFNHPLNERIDFIFVGKEVKVKKYAVLSDSKNQRYYSDHLPVFATIEL